MTPSARRRRAAAARSKATAGLTVPRAGCGGVACVHRRAWARRRQTGAVVTGSLSVCQRRAAAAPPPHTEADSVGAGCHSDETHSEVPARALRWREAPARRAVGCPSGPSARHRVSPPPESRYSKEQPCKQRNGWRGVVRVDRGTVGLSQTARYDFSIPFMERYQ